MGRGLVVHIIEGESGKGEERDEKVFFNFFFF